MDGTDEIETEPLLGPLVGPPQGEIAAAVAPPPMSFGNRLPRSLTSRSSAERRQARLSAAGRGRGTRLCFTSKA